MNGKVLDGALHAGSHPSYSDKVAAKMQDIFNSYGSNSPTSQQAKQELIDLVNAIKVAIDANPGINVNNLSF